MREGVRSRSRPSVPAVCIGGAHSDVGKTTVSLGIMAALRRRGLEVQAFKIGPDFIDPGHHRRVTGRDSHNLDGWMLDRAVNRGIFARYAGDADAAVVEGVMGLFDGFSGTDESGSTAQMAKWLGLPAVLVIDASAMARSAAAVALGFDRYDPGLRLAGVIFNRVAGEAHARMLVKALESLGGIPALGCLPFAPGLEIPARHLGLLTEEEFNLSVPGVEHLAEWAERNLDLDRLMETRCGLPATGPGPGAAPAPLARIGVARDEAFCFYYAENLRLLRESGAELEPFSPLRDRKLPDGCGGLYLGGGYPEMHAAALSANRALRDEIRRFALAGGAVYAECGGFMYLMDRLIDLTGASHPMVGLFPMTSHMEGGRMSLGYREITTLSDSILGPSGTRVRGHEFHYSEVRSMRKETARVYAVTDGRLPVARNDAFVRNRAVGSYVHQHWGSNPRVAAEFVESCRRWVGRR